MASSQNPNIEILELAAVALGPICDELVFLGGCAVGLLITDSAAPPVRVTRDVDTVTEIASIAEYYEMGKRLRDRGFEVDPSKDAPICRWIGNRPVTVHMQPAERLVEATGVS